MFGQKAVIQVKAWSLMRPCFLCAALFIHIISEGPYIYGMDYKNSHLNLLQQSKSQHKG